MISCSHPTERIRECSVEPKPRKVTGPRVKVIGWGGQNALMTEGVRKPERQGPTSLARDFACIRGLTFSESTSCSLNARRLYRALTYFFLANSLSESSSPLSPLYRDNSRIPQPHHTNIAGSKIALLTCRTLSEPFSLLSNIAGC